MKEVRDSLLQHEESYRMDLLRIGQAIGYGRSQQILGELWDEMLNKKYGISSGTGISRGAMGVTIDDDPKP